MTNKTPSSFTVGKGIALQWEGTVLVEAAGFYVPTLLHRLEVYKLSFPYEDDDDAALGETLTTAQQEALLMNIGDRLISEVRSLRDGNQTPAEMRDPQLDPYSLPLTSLRTIAASVDDTNADLSTLIGQGNQLLTEIRDQLAAGAGGEDVLERLDILITLLGTVA